MIEISLFVDGDHIDTMKREVVPRAGETIVLDCGDMVIVTEINHQWDDYSLVQIKAERVGG